MFMPPWRFGRDLCLTRLSKTTSRERAADFDGEGDEVSEMDEVDVSDCDTEPDELGGCEGKLGDAMAALALLAVAVWTLFWPPLNSPSGAGLSLSWWGL
jgi:hypothetical protein